MRNLGAFCTALILTTISISTLKPVTIFVTTQRQLTYNTLKAEVWITPHPKNRQLTVAVICDGEVAGGPSDQTLDGRFAAIVYHKGPYTISADYQQCNVLAVVVREDGSTVRASKTVLFRGE